MKVWLVYDEGEVMAVFSNEKARECAEANDWNDIEMQTVRDTYEAEPLDHDAPNMEEE